MVDEFEDKELGEVIEEVASKQLQEREEKWTQEQIDNLHRFYVASYSSKKDDWSISLDNYEIINILRELGYARYEQPGAKNFEYVYIHDGRIRILESGEKIIDAFEDYVKDLPGKVWTDHDNDGEVVEIEIDGEKLLRKIYKNLRQYFSATLGRLRPARPITIMGDTKNSKYVFYNNCVVRITKDRVEEWPYRELHQRLKEAGEQNGEYIWENNILDRDYIQSVKIGDFQKFCQYISGYYKEAKEQKTGCQRFNALRSIFGYLMHNNYECNLKSIMFIDVNKEHSGKPAGGTGKGIIGKALGFMLNRDESDCKSITVGGKSFDPKGERRYSAGDITTQLVHIEDISDKFSFVDFFNDVTDGAPFRKMYCDPVVHRVKTMLSSNIPLDLSAPSCKRRLVVFELDNYFSEHRTPVDVFGHFFFGSEWNKEDWNMFDSFMVQCCFYYMGMKDEVVNGKVVGIVTPPEINYKANLLKAKLPESFYEWFKERVDAMPTDKPTTIVKGDWYKTFSEAFIEYADARLYKRKFTEWMVFYLETLQIPCGAKRSSEDILVIYPEKGDMKMKYIVE